jgi:ankyrin repeat protein
MALLADEAAEKLSLIQKLFFAIKTAKVEEVAELLPKLKAKDIDLNITDNKGLTPLMYAGSSLDIAKLIVRANPATLFAKTKEGDTVIIAMIRNYPQNKEFFYTMSPEHIPQVGIGVPGDIYTYKIISVIDYLIKKGVDINATNRAGESALWWAVKIGNRDIVRSLLEEHATIDQKTTAIASPSIRSLLLEYEFEPLESDG